MTTVFDTAQTEAAKRVAETVLVLMGSSGSGKTTVALELRRPLGWPVTKATICILWPKSQRCDPAIP